MQAYMDVGFLSLIKSLGGISLRGCPLLGQTQDQSTGGLYPEAASGFHLGIPHLKRDRDQKEAFTDSPRTGLACLSYFRSMARENDERLYQRAGFHQRNRSLTRQSNHIIIIYPGTLREQIKALLLVSIKDIMGLSQVNEMSEQPRSRNVKEGELS